MKFLSGLFKFFVFIYLLGCGAIYFFQEKVIFNPEHISEDYNYGMGSEVEIPLHDGISMNALWVKDRSSKGVILYLHGNRGSIRFGTYQIRHFEDRGYDILIPDYRSYGKTEGRPKNQKQMLKDADSIYSFLKKNYKEENIYVVGYSLGTGMASYLASKNNPNHLLLVAPYTSLTDIKNKYLWFVPDFLLKYKFPIKDYLENVKSKITVVHGTSDRIVDYNFSKKLKEKFKSKIKLYSATNVSHRRIIFDRSLRGAVDDMLY